MEKQRSAGLDIIRTLAIVFVAGSHFFLHTTFNNVGFAGGEMFFLAALQTLFLTNVCLFMMLTGYLNCNKKPCRKYYKGILRVLGSYLFFSLLLIAFRKWWLGETFTWLQWTKMVLKYSAIPYGWYIEMWIGLFLLTPFLNVLWHGIDTKRNKLLLIATLFVMGACPDFTNRYGAYLFPGWWQQASFPLIYFFLGCYIREYQPVVSKKLLGGGIIFLCLLNPLFNALFMRGHTMVHIIGGQGGVVVVPLTVLVFLLCYKADVRSDWARKAFKSVSLLSLDMYLVSYVFDALCYPFFSERVFAGVRCHYLLTFVTVVPLVLLSSYLVALAKKGVADVISQILTNFRARKLNADEKSSDSPQ